MESSEIVAALESAAARNSLNERTALVVMHMYSKLGDAERAESEFEVAVASVFRRLVTLLMTAQCLEHVRAHEARRVCHDAPDTLWSDAKLSRSFCDCFTRNGLLGYGVRFLRESAETKSAQKAEL